uniref:Presenilin n=1 Tax=Panagrellus redivivus TaxID=6233 RepID=A0A7E4V6U8_PANRE
MSATGASSEPRQHAPSNRQNGRRQSTAEEAEETELKYGAAHVIRLFAPVSLCMAAVIFTMNTVNYYSRDDGVYLLYTPFTKKTDDTAERLAMSIGNALTVLAVVVVMTCILIALYYFRFYKVIHGWLIMSSAMLLSLFMTMYLQEVFKGMNIAVDYVSYLFFLWNFAAMGMICIHWKGPLILQQGYLIIISALMALTLIKYLPEWTVWTVLAVISIWDLVAVLCPRGPLRMLVETAQERNEPIFPALIYSSTVIYPFVVFGATTATDSPTSGAPLVQPSSGESSQTPTPASVRYAPLRNRNQQQTEARNGAHRPNSHPVSSATTSSESNRDQRPHHHRPNGEVEVIEEEGIKLGLGDFIFYSVLVGKASSYGDWNTTIACYVAILVGLASTLMLLAVYRKALPALPISIFAGLIFYFATSGLMTPFMSELTMMQITP